MPTIPFTLDALVGLAIGFAFAFICLKDLSRGVLWFVALGWIPFFQVASLSGSEFTTGFMQVEWLGTILIGVWLLKKRRAGSPLVVRTRFDRPLLWLIPASFISLVAGFLGLDPFVDTNHVKLAVSIGQILLFAWPIGIYFVVADSMATTEAVRTVLRLAVILAAPAVVLPFLPARYVVFVEWSVYFALAVSPFCFARSLQPSSVMKRAALLAIALSPAVYGILLGKALWYIAPLAGFAVIAALAARRLLFAALPLALGAYLLLFVPLTGSWLPGEVKMVIAEEEAQQSIGGRSGRDALAADAVKIWARYPVFGVGPGNNYPYMIRYSAIGTAHGQYTNLLLELGVVGLLCYLAFVGMAISTGLQLLRSVRKGFHRTLTLGWLGLFVGLVAVGGLLGDFSLPSIRNDGLHVFSWYYLQWVMLGLMVAVKRIEGR
jgi:hypothetical protein